MKLIVGLGNPGKKYENTRHNIGFMAVDNLANKYSVTFKEKFQGLYGELIIDNEKILLLKPQKYMNLSGEVIRKYVDFYKIDINDILIICDDLDLEVGKIRLRYRGSSGGHNGLKNIEHNLVTQNYKRLKIGIANNKLIDTKDYVLGKFNNEEFEKIAQICELSSKILKDFLVGDINKIMSKYNGVEYEIK